VAEQIVGKRDGNGKLAVAARTRNEQGVSQTVLIHTAPQLFNYSSLSYYVLEKNSHQYISFAIS
jgi:hypothetical protein